MASPALAQQAKKPRTEQADPAAPAAAAADAAAAPAAAAAGAAPAAAAAGGALAAAAAAGAAAVEKVWAKGTGYGYSAYNGHRGGGSSGPVWDAKAAAAAQEAQDEQMNSVLQSLGDALLQEFPSSSSEAEPSAAAAESSGSGSGGAQQAGELTPSQEKCLAALHASVLRPLLARELSHVAFPEMVQRHQYYEPLLKIVRALCHPALERFVSENAAAEEQAEAAAGSSSSKAAGQQAGQVVSIVGAVRGLQKGATIVQKQLSKHLEAAAAAPTTSVSTRVDKAAGGYASPWLLAAGWKYRAYVVACMQGTGTLLLSAYHPLCGVPNRLHVAALPGL